MAILSDDKLPLDKVRVAIGGFSAGGNLALAVSQEGALQGKLNGLAAYYPLAAYFSNSHNIVLKSRLANSRLDLSNYFVTMLRWSYLHPEQDLKDPQVSVKYTKRDRLPPKIFITGCEIDFLRRNAEFTAERLAKKEWTWRKKWDFRQLDEEWCEVAENSW